MYLAVLTADSVGTLSSSFQGTVVGITAWTCALLGKTCCRVMKPGKTIKRKTRSAYTETPTDLFFSTVAFFSVFQVTVTAAMPSIHCPGVGQVKETLSSSRAQVALQLLHVAIIKDSRKRMPEHEVRKKSGSIFSFIFYHLSPFSWFNECNFLYCGKLNFIPSSSSHDTASVFCFRLATTWNVVAHTKVVSHLVRHRGSNAD